MKEDVVAANLANLRQSINELKECIEKQNTTVPKPEQSVKVLSLIHISEICEKYHINDSSVWAHVRKYSIPSRQIGNYVYVPKQEIDNLYKSEVK